MTQTKSPHRTKTFRPGPILFSALLLCLVCTPLLSRAAILPFASDGCSRFPEGTPQDQALWRQCCVAHDLAYWCGGTYSERLAADFALEQCVADSGEAWIGSLMLAGVRIGGSPYWPTGFRWGYGWHYLRGYEPLSVEERQAVRLALNEAGYPAPQGWQEPAVPIPSSSVSNWFRISDKLYRSAQPDAAGMREVAARGITTVLNLRAYHSDDDEASDTGLRLVRVPMQAAWIGDAEIIEALRAIRQAPGPVLVHCWHGADRTGLVVAMYRILEQGWSKEAAIAEMVGGGFGYHVVFPNLIAYIERADIETLRNLLARSANVMGR